MTGIGAGPENSPPIPFDNLFFLIYRRCMAGAPRRRTASASSASPSASGSRSPRSAAGCWSGCASRPRPPSSPPSSASAASASTTTCARSSAAGLLDLVEERPRRGFTERILAARADAFVVDPAVLGAVAARRGAGPLRRRAPDRRGLRRRARRRAHAGRRATARARGCSRSRSRRTCASPPPADLERFCDAARRPARARPPPSTRRRAAAARTGSCSAAIPHPTHPERPPMPERAVAVETTIAAPFATVWNALRDPAAIRRWHGWEYDERGGSTARSRSSTSRPPWPTRPPARSRSRDGSRFELEDRGAETVVRVTMPAPAADASWDEFYDDVREGWTSFVQQLRFALERAPRRGTPHAPARRAPRRSFGRLDGAPGERLRDHDAVGRVGSPGASPSAPRTRSASPPTATARASSRVHATPGGGGMASSPPTASTTRPSPRSPSAGAPATPTEPRAAIARPAYAIVRRSPRRATPARGPRCRRSPAATRGCRVAAGELPDQRRSSARSAGRAAGRPGPCRPRARPRPRRSAPSTRPAARRMPSSPSASRAPLELRELLGRVVPLHPRHHLDRIDELVARRLVRVVEHVEDVREPRPQLLPRRSCSSIRSSAGARAGRGSSPSRTSVRRDLLEREAHPAQRQDPVQAADVAVAVEPVARLRARGRHEQADLVVVVQRADGQARGLATAPIRRRVAHVHRGRR